MGRIIKFEKTKWPRSVFNPQKLLRPETSTSTLKLPLSPRPNLMPFPSRETASATKCHHVKCHQLFCWRHQKQQSCTLEPSCGIRLLALVLYIYSGNTLQYIFMYDLKKKKEKKKKKKKKKKS